MSVLYADITGCSNIIRVTVSSSHSSQLATAMFEVETSSLIVGDEVVIDIGYDTDHDVVFTGYVKSIDLKEPEKTYQIMASDKLVRASEYFIASANPKTPFSRQNIALEDLVEDLLELAGMTLDSHEDTSFTIATGGSKVEVNLTTCLDFCKYLGDVVTWSIWADETGNIHFENRKPYIMVGDVSIGTIDATNTIQVKQTTTAANLRNRVVVYGSGSIYAEASAASPYLPADFYRTVVVAVPQLFVAQEMAQMAADNNLETLNRLTTSISAITVGNHEYLARKIITANFPTIGVTNDDYYIFSVEHDWSSQGYMTSLELRV